MSEDDALDQFLQTFDDNQRLERQACHAFALKTIEVFITGTVEVGRDLRQRERRMGVSARVQFIKTRPEVPSGLTVLLGLHLMSWRQRCQNGHTRC